MEASTQNAAGSWLQLEDSNQSIESLDPTYFQNSLVNSAFHGLKTITVGNGQPRRAGLTSVVKDWGLADNGQSPLQYRFN